MQERVVIVSPELGIYLGSFMGMGIWSKLDPAGQECAVTFADVADAESFMATWSDKDAGAPYSFHDVVADVGGSYASMDACVKGGLEAWDPGRAPAYLPKASPVEGQRHEAVEVVAYDTLSMSSGGSNG